jgi:hypothetical protein
MIKKFSEKYSSLSSYEEKQEKEKKEEKRIVLSDDAFAIGEIIEQLINKIEHARISIMQKR